MWFASEGERLLLIPLFLAAVSDLREGKIYNWQSAMGLALGIGLTWAGGGGWTGVFLFFLRVIGTCLIFALFFLCRMLGAGDIKMMAVCAGALGVRRGALMIFLSFLGAALEAAYRLIRKRALRDRLLALARFSVRAIWSRRLERYPAAGTVHMGPWLLAGFGLMEILGR